jgi:hypothetical protein
MLRPSMHPTPGGRKRSTPLGWHLNGAHLAGLTGSALLPTRLATTLQRPPPKRTPCGTVCSEARLLTGDAAQGSQKHSDCHRRLRHRIAAWPPSCRHGDGARSNQVANWLRERGVARGDRVIVMLGNQVELWETILAPGRPDQRRAGRGGGDRAGPLTPSARSDDRLPRFRRAQRSRPR